ncbi:MAG: OmpA family protein [Bacteroidia bacterium]
MLSRTNLLFALFIVVSLGAMAQTSEQLVQTHFSGLAVTYPQKGSYFKQFHPGIALGGSVHISRWMNANLTAGIAPSVKYPTDNTPGGSMFIDFHSGFQLKFNNGSFLKENARFAPYLYGGVGYSAMEDKKGIYAPIGLGMKVKLGNKVTLNWESIYRQSFSSTIQPMTHSLGISYTIVSGKSLEFNSKNKANWLTMDDDKDGILNKDDSCPLDAGIKSNSGCPDMIGKVNPNDPKNPNNTENISGLELDDEKQISSIAKSIIFKPNTDELLQSSKSALDQLALIMKKYPTYRLVIEAHTDNASGDANLNRTISIKQSYKVKSYLALEKGVSATRITGDGYGDTRPIANNASESGRRANRRVELKMVTR